MHYPLTLCTPNPRAWILAVGHASSFLFFRRRFKINIKEVLQIFIFLWFPGSLPWSVYWYINGPTLINGKDHSMSHHKMQFGGFLPHIYFKLIFISFWILGTHKMWMQKSAANKCCYVLISILIFTNAKKGDEKYPRF